MKLNQNECQRCGRATYNEELCSPCKSYIKLKTNCRHYTEKEKSCTVPYCELKDVEILGIDGSYYCNHCEDKEVEAWNS